MQAHDWYQPCAGAQAVCRRCKVRKWGDRLGFLDANEKRYPKRLPSDDCDLEAIREVLES